MNSEKQHPKDPLIQQEIEAMRAVDLPQYGPVKAMEAMRKSPSARPRRTAWSLGMGMTAVAVAVLFVPFGAQKANAAEIRRIGDAQRAQKTRYCQSFQLNPQGKLFLAYEEWLDGNKHAQTFYRPQGGLSGAINYNGNFNYVYYPANTESGQPAWASKDNTGAENTPLETVDSYMNIPAIREYTSKPGVIRNGKKCDFYSFGKGMYQLYVDPATRLPIEREIYSKGQLIERDSYEYPARVAASTFDAPSIKGVEFYDYPAGREKLEDIIDPLRKTGGAVSGVHLSPQTIKVGSASVTLHQVIQAPNEILVIWTGTTAQDMPPNGKPFVIDGLENKPTVWTPTVEMDFFTYRLHRTFEKRKLSTAVLYTQPNRPISAPFTVKIPVWDKNKKLVGTAKFEVYSTFKAPSAQRLLWPPSSTSAIATAKASP